LILIFFLDFWIFCRILDFFFVHNQLILQSEVKCKQYLYFFSYFLGCVQLRAASYSVVFAKVVYVLEFCLNSFHNRSLCLCKVLVRFFLCVNSCSSRLGNRYVNRGTFFDPTTTGFHLNKPSSFFFLDFFFSEGRVVSKSNEATEPTCELAADDSGSSCPLVPKEEPFVGV